MFFSATLARYVAGIRPRSSRDTEAAATHLAAPVRAEQGVCAYHENHTQEPTTRAIAELEYALAPVLAAMEVRGICMDASRLTALNESLSITIASAQANAWREAGETFNLASTRAVQTILFDKLGLPSSKKTKTGATRSVDTEVLEWLLTAHPIVEHLVAYRTATKLKSAFVDALLSSINPHTGRVHTTLLQTNTATGRLASINPNLQNIPFGTEAASEIRRAFVAPKGWTLVVGDYSQVELRVLAALSQDPGFVSVFASGRDIHTETARFLFGSDHTITPDQRRIAKTVNFGVIYGVTSYGLSRSAGVSASEASIFIKAFYERYPGVRAYYDALLAQGRERGYVETYFGRRRNIPALNDANRVVRGAAEREAMNAPIQGTAADAVKFAMVALEHAIAKAGLRARLLLQVHDELILECPEEEAEATQKLLKETMETAVNIGVPLTADVHAWLDWHTAKSGG